MEKTKNTQKDYTQAIECVQTPQQFKQLLDEIVARKLGRTSNNVKNEVLSNVVSIAKRMVEHPNAKDVLYYIYETKNAKSIEDFLENLRAGAKAGTREDRTTFDTSLLEGLF